MEEGVDSFTQIELGVGDEAAHIIDEGEQVGLSPLPLHHDHRAVHGVTLPDVIGQLCLIAPAVYGRGVLGAHQAVLMEQTVEGAEAQLSAHTEKPPSTGLSNDGTDRGINQLFSEPHQALGCVLIHGPGPSPVFSVLGIERLQAASARLVSSDPAQDGGWGQTGPGGKGDLPAHGALLPEQPLLLPPGQLRAVDKVADDPKAEHCNLPFLLLVHEKPPFSVMGPALNRPFWEIKGTLR